MNLEDPKQKRMHDILKKGMRPLMMDYGLQNIWMHIANDVEPNNDIIPERLIRELGDEEEALELFNHYLRNIPKYRFKGDTLTELIDEIGPPERKVYHKYDPCPCGSDMKYKFCCMNRNRLLENKAVLEKEDIHLLYALIDDMLYFTNQRVGVADKDQYQQDFISNLSQDEYLELKKHLFDNTEHIDAYIAEHFDEYASGTLDVLADMRRSITGQFIAIRYLDQKLVLLASDEKTAYVLSGISAPLSELVSFDRLPVFLKLTLLPFKGRIVFPIDFHEMPFSLGPNMRDHIDEVMKNIKLTTAL